MPIPPAMLPGSSGPSSTLRAASGSTPRPPTASGRTPWPSERSVFWPPASGRPGDASRSADRLFDPADAAYHPVVSSWLIGDLAEAAVHLERGEQASARVAQVQEAVGSQPGPWIALGLCHARAVLASPE